MRYGTHYSQAESGHEPVLAGLLAVMALAGFAGGLLYGWLLWG